MVALQIAGGVALTIFGVRFLRKGLDRLFGLRLMAWMAGMTRKPWRGFLSGMVVGTVAPSSTALSLMSVQMLNTGRLTANQMLAVLLGANVGITVTVQLLAFHMQDYAGLLLLFGVIGFQFLNRDLFRGIGQCLLALGFVFLAMGLISDAAATLKEDPTTYEWLRLFGGRPMLAFFFVAGFTLCVQSSTASIGFALGLAGAGLIGGHILVPWVLGANFGLALTALVAGWSTLEGKRLATANLLMKSVVALPFLLFPFLGQGIFHWLPGSLGRQTAMFHTLYNLAVGLIALPLVGPLMALVRRMVIPPLRGGSLPTVASYLDPQALESPSLALANATRETLLLTDGVKAMLQYFWMGYSKRDLDLIVRVEGQDDIADRQYVGIKDYLRRIGDVTTAEETHWLFTLLTFSNELESVGDIVERQMCDILRRQTSERVWLVAEDYAALETMYEKVSSRFAMAQGLLANRSVAVAREFVDGKEELNEWCRQAQRAHYTRLQTGAIDSITASGYFLDLLDAFRRINSHITAIGYALTGGPTARPPETRSVEVGAVTPRAADAQAGG